MSCRLSMKRVLPIVVACSILIYIYMQSIVVNNEANQRSVKRQVILKNFFENQGNAEATGELANKSKTQAVTVTASTTVVTDQKRDDRFPWFFQNGSKKATKSEAKREIWPQQDTRNDRIVNQLMYIPENYDEERSPLKTIILWNGLEDWVKPGRKSFLECGCPVDKCSISEDHSKAANADAILFKDRAYKAPRERNPAQVWIIFLLECPFHTPMTFNAFFNWTATYRTDSDIVAPYAKWIYYDDNVKQTTLTRNFAANKTSMVAWFVSNCRPRNNRYKYAEELSKHISVDIYGKCGSHSCPRIESCFKLLSKNYKFYLAFENSNCVNYITEKLFSNALSYDVLPIVMGARPEDYAAVAPYHSYIHVDDFASPKELAVYLQKLDKDDDLYNSYFRWKGTGEFINTYFFCRLCAMLHDNHEVKSYSNFLQWWKGESTCTNGGPWRNNQSIGFQ